MAPRTSQQKKDYKLQESWLTNALTNLTWTYTHVDEVKLQRATTNFNKLMASLTHSFLVNSSWVSVPLPVISSDYTMAYFTSISPENSLVRAKEWVGAIGAVNYGIMADGTDAVYNSILSALNSDVNSYKTLVAKLQANKDDDVRLLQRYNSEITYLQDTKLPFNKKDYAGIVKGNIPKIISTYKTKLFYNSSAPYEAYFSSKEQFAFSSLGKTYYPMNKDGNIPKRIINEPLDELWRQSTNHKGMIIPSSQTIFKSTSKDSAGTPTNPIVPSALKNKATTFDLANNRSRYAFQFLYNPGTVQMQYQGTPDVDVGMATSGSDQFALIGGLGVTQSTISFDILLNRTYDMKYYDDETHLLKAGVTTQEVYPVWTHDKEENGVTPYLASLRAQKAIYRKGTMYDLEYLLRALLGYASPAYLRGGDYTADIGYVGAMPVELHLGQSLRYLGIITSLSVKHLTFNERMVPLFTSVSLVFNRIPDFSGINNDPTNLGPADVADITAKYDISAKNNAGLGPGAIGRDSQ